MKRLYIPIIVSLVLFSCEEEDAIKSNEIIDDNGIIISLEWDLTNSSLPPTEAANLDLRITNDGTLVRESAVQFQYERAQLPTNLSNDIYDIEITYFEGSQDVVYTLFFESENGNQVFSKGGQIPATLVGSPIRVGEIQKSGNSFTIQ